MSWGDTFLDAWLGAAERGRHFAAEVATGEYPLLPRDLAALAPVRLPLGGSAAWAARLQARAELHAARAERPVTLVDALMAEVADG